MTNHEDDNDIEDDNADPVWKAPAFAKAETKAFVSRYQRPASPYRSNGQLLTRGLFLEYWVRNKNAIYTVEREDVHDPVNGKTYLSLYKLYLAENDLLERDFANKYFDSYQHWKRVQEIDFVKAVLPIWREELAVKTRTEALRIIEAEAYAGSKYSYPAAVFLAKEGWKVKPETPKSTRSAGRPSKAQIAEEANRIAMEAHDVDDDLARLDLTKLTAN